MTSNEARREELDAQGRVPGAPAWDGDLAAVSPHGLEEHDRGLCGQIANLTVRREEVVADGAEPWKVRSAEERRKHGFDEWVGRLVDVRNEQHRRHEQVGGVNVYLSLLDTPRWYEPWA